VRAFEHECGPAPTSATSSHNTMRTVLGTLLTLGTLLLSPVPGAAQGDGSDTAASRHAHTRTVSLFAGATQFDLSGTGTTAMVGARADVELNRWFLGELGFGAIRPTEQFSSRSTYVFPEVQLQAQLPLAIVRPYIGAGAGFSTAFARGAGSATTCTATLASGLRVLLPGTRTTARAELRVRGIADTFTGATADWTLGLGRRF
jgi:hypothetical protein